MRVIGLDLSLRATGIAIIDTDTRGIHVDVIRTHPVPECASEHEALVLTAKRIDAIASRIGLATFRAEPHLVAIEKPPYGISGGRKGAASGSQAHERAGLWWEVVRRLTTAHRPYATVNVSTLKAYATGKGNAEKVALMQAAMRRLGDACPDLPDDNATDALWLALMAAHRVGAPLLELPKAQADRLGSVAWPELLSDEEGAA